jgi:predicted enzyme related to lactoylglutathione lyase
MPSRVVHFEIHAEDPERAADFYTQVFGWTIRKWEGPAEYWLVVTGSQGEPGINGGLLRRRITFEGGDAVNAFVCSIDVPSVDDYAGRIVAHGGAIVVPKMAIRGVGWVLYAKDTEGNIFGIAHADPSAA